MTTAWPSEKAVLVRAPTAPDVDGVAVDVRPGPVTTFDGDRPRGVLVVAAPARGVRETHPRDGVPDVVAAARRLLLEHDGEVLRLGNRACLWEFRPESTVRAIERRLADVARSGGATLVTWTDREPRQDDAAVYDAVVEAPDGDLVEALDDAAVDGRDDSAVEGQGSDVAAVEGPDARRDQPP